MAISLAEQATTAADAFPAATELALAPLRLQLKHFLWLPRGRGGPGLNLISILNAQWDKAQHNLIIIMQK